MNPIFLTNRLKNLNRLKDGQQALSRRMTLFILASTTLSLECLTFIHVFTKLSVQILDEMHGSEAAIRSLDFADSLLYSAGDDHNLRGWDL